MPVNSFAHTLFSSSSSLTELPKLEAADKSVTTWSVATFCPYLSFRFDVVRSIVVLHFMQVPGQLSSTCTVAGKLASTGGMKSKLRGLLWRGGYLPTPPYPRVYQFEAETTAGAFERHDLQVDDHGGAHSFQNAGIAFSRTQSHKW